MQQHFTDRCDIVYRTDDEKRLSTWSQRFVGIPFTKQRHPIEQAVSQNNQIKV